ncbi:MAG: GNAT family N-acetyltransferase [Paludibacterium sp.]|uniref:GNAT family N-acetyltransferase n=1 Tax=Paludibacterium sp. TaxID=1917523 RepID=UPI0025E7EA75|nr:GNAT family N-acetyltransferase [Paludibacterium sp.]MBV8045909.1 GNAT family N-acetyltransferase [Paludibacterium sp.]MBV8648586.1 GNAT family N-acetyltransferase [Paludibacterium sp.]
MPTQALFQANLDHLAIRPATAYEFAAVVRLYDEGGYDGRYQASDFLLLAMIDMDAVGVVRLVKEEGYTLLRGLYIGKAWRGRGIGRRLLTAAAGYLTEPCYCLTQTSLLHLFAEQGFVPCSDDIVPPFLLERRRRYGWTGKTYHVIYRPD